MSWDDEGPAARFWKRLVRERAIEFMRCPDYLKGLRYNNKRAVADQKTFGHIWEEYGTNVYKLIAEACGETWDEEDDAKCPAAEERHAKKEVAVNQKEAIASDDDLVGTREASACERVDELQGKFEESFRELEEAKERREAEEEQGAPQEKGRGEEFYRRAGGGGPD